MPTELGFLGATLVLALVQILLPGWERTRQVGLAWNAGPRDEPPPPPTVLGGRFQRAQANLYETLPLFLAADLAAVLLHRTGPLSAAGAGLYFVGRLIYVPLYALGVPYWRSVAWGAALTGLLALIAALFGA